MIQNVRGTKDLLAEETYELRFLETAIQNTVRLFGYNEIRTPIFERTEVFSRAIGEVTDIVNKEMYTFDDRGGNSITLRPEMTAALVRAAIQHNIVQGSHAEKLWYYGPFFRYERPQKGRQRMFHQFGAECLGSDKPESDAELILMADQFIRTLSIGSYSLEINSIGDAETRRTYNEELVKYLNQHKSKLSKDSQERLDVNPLRILDSKSLDDQEILKNAPIITDFLKGDSKYCYDEIKSILDEVGVYYKEQPKLVRGLDYYSDIVFEFKSDALGAQDAFGGGGRYNGLFEQLGGKPTPGVGFAMGIERLMLIMEAENLLPKDPGPDFYIVLGKPEESEYRSRVASMLRGRGYSVLYDLNRRSFKTQFKEANKVNATYAIVLGSDEINNDLVSIKEMSSGEQRIMPFNELSTTNF
ncbi:MAG: histidine--tRNA ligase [Candidatus Kapaibacteriales bacterium]